MQSFSEADFDFEDGDSTAQAVSAANERPAVELVSSSHSDDRESLEDVPIAATREGSSSVGKKARLSTLVLETSTPPAARPPRGTAGISDDPAIGLADSFASLDVSTPTRDGADSSLRTRTPSAAHTLRPLGIDDEHHATDDSFHEVIPERSDDVTLHPVQAVHDATEEWIDTDVARPSPRSVEVVLVDLVDDQADVGGVRRGTAVGDDGV